MKKTKLLCLSLLASLMLAGCGGAKAQFKDVTMKERLTNQEQTLVLSQMRSALSNKLSSFSMKSNRVDKSAISEQTTDRESTVTFYNGNYVHAEGVTKTESKTQGLIVKDEVKNTSDYFMLKDNVVGAYSVNDDEASWRAVPGTGNAVYEAGLELIGNVMDGLVGYKDAKDNIYFIAVNYDEDYTPVQYGADTAIVHTITKSQTVLEINKDFTIKSYYSYQSRETNQDPETSEIGKKVSLVREIKSSAEFSYKNRKDNEKGYSDIKSEMSNKYIFVGNPSLNAKVGDAQFGINSQLTTKKVGYGKYECFAQVSFEVGKAPLNEVGKELKLYLQGNINLLGSNEANTAVNIDVTNVSFAGKVDLTQQQDVDLIVKFNLELSKDKTNPGSVSDVSVYLA